MDEALPEKLPAIIHHPVGILESRQKDMRVKRKSKLDSVDICAQPHIGLASGDCIVSVSALTRFDSLMRTIFDRKPGLSIFSNFVCMTWLKWGLLPGKELDMGFQTLLKGLRGCSAVLR